MDQFHSIINIESVVNEHAAMMRWAFSDIGTTPDHVETRKSSDSSQQAHFSLLYTESKFFSDGPRLMTVVLSSPDQGVLFYRGAGALKSSFVCTAPAVLREMLFGRDSSIEDRMHSPLEDRDPINYSTWYIRWRSRQAAKAFLAKRNVGCSRERTQDQVIRLAGVVKDRHHSNSLLNPLP
ncbi:unnamed protein product [Soboliphyme baturini]|uniref:DUF2384 domain-containing protein n=1 Tax=Soboliphyme baturini TaxID=241478 RepID=A0A183II82_9BILA|nr:unnamed protein product [Soboliphyme baturini]